MEGVTSETFEDVEADAAEFVNVGVIDAGHKTHFGSYQNSDRWKGEKHENGGEEKRGEERRSEEERGREGRREEESKSKGKSKSKGASARATRQNKNARDMGYSAVRNSSSLNTPPSYGD